jgi:hypothetical protein
MNGNRRFDAMGAGGAEHAAGDRFYEPKLASASRAGDRERADRRRGERQRTAPASMNRM